jgi:GTP cyclohydrolase II
MTEKTFSFISSCALPTIHGDFEMRVYRNTIGQDAMALVVRMYHGKKACTKTNETKRLVGGAAAMFDSLKEDITDKERSILLRVQDQCITSEIFGSIRCDCKQQLDASLSLLQKKAVKRFQFASSQSHYLNEDEIIGMVIYLLQEGRGIGIGAKVSAYALQDEGGLSRSSAEQQHRLDTVDANRALGLPDDVREYSAVPDILRDLGVLDDVEQPVFLLTNNPRKVELIESLDVTIKGRISCLVPAVSALAAAYLRSKAERMGHDIPSSIYEWEVKKS